jgi:sulfate transport system ATP-binding protein
VFEHPANPFVMDFLGNVNVFTGRVQNGRALLGNLEVACPDYPHAEARQATFYMRPHELDILQVPNGVPSLKAQVKRINPAGPVAKIFLHSADFGVGLNVELSPERYKELALKTGDTVYVAPRKVRVFVPEYII